MKDNNFIKNVKLYWNALKRKYYCFTDLICFTGMKLALAQVDDNLRIYLRVAMVLMLLSITYNTIKHLKLTFRARHLKRDTFILVTVLFYLLIIFVI